VTRPAHTEISGRTCFIGTKRDWNADANQMGFPDGHFKELRRSLVGSLRKSLAQDRRPGKAQLGSSESG
jgi:hypothetical protein